MFVKFDRTAANWILSRSWTYQAIWDRWTWWPSGTQNKRVQATPIQVGLDFSSSRPQSCNTTPCVMGFTLNTHSYLNFWQSSHFYSSILSEQSNDHSFIRLFGSHLYSFLILWYFFMPFYFQEEDKCRYYYCPGELSSPISNYRFQSSSPKEKYNTRLIYFPC